MKSNFTWSRYYSRETQDKTLLASCASVNYDVDGVSFHPIGKAFTEAKNAGQEEVKDFYPSPFQL